MNVTFHSQYIIIIIIFSQSGQTGFSVTARVYPCLSHIQNLWSIKTNTDCWQTSVVMRNLPLKSLLLLYIPF